MNALCVPIPPCSDMTGKVKESLAPAADHMKVRLCFFLLFFLLLFPAVFRWAPTRAKSN